MLRPSSAVLLCALVVVTVGVAACPTVDIPDDARIGCTSDDECPSGFECREGLGLCVQLGGGDRTAPGIASSTVTPEVGGEGTVVVVTFSPDEPLIQDPAVVLVTADGTRPFVVGRDGDGYRATITARADDGDGVRDIRATLDDLGGNRADDVPLGRVTLDFSRPVITASVSPAAANDDVDVVVTVRAGEAVGDASTVTLVDGRAFEIDPVGADPNERTFRLRPTPGTDSEGDRVIDVVVADGAGNVATTQTTVRLDFTAPGIEGDAVIGRPVVTAGQVATVGLRADEAIARAVVALVPLSEDEEGDGEALTLTLDDLSGRDLQLRREIGAADVDGVYTVRVVELVDLAGNVATDIELPASVIVDRGAPTFATAPTTTPVTLSRQPDNDVVTVAFTLNERADVDVRMGPVALVCEDDGAAPEVVYTCVYGVDADDLDGTFAVTISAVDAAGNTAFATAPSVTIDTSPPVVVVNAIPAGIVRGGETVSIAAVADENLDGARLQLTVAPLPPLPATTTLAFSTPSTSGRSATSTATVPAGIEGSFSVTVVAADLGGNTAAPVTTTIAVDSLAPRLVSSALSTPRAAPGAAFSFEIVASEALRTAPTASFANGDVVGGVPVVVPMVLETAFPAADDRYRFTATAPSSGQNQFYTVTTVLEDLAGNSGVESPAVIVIDNAPPRLAGFDITPRAAKAGDVVRVVVTADETLGAVPTIVARNGAATLTLSAGGAASGALSYVFTTTVGAGTPQGTWSFDAFDVVDAAGNRATIAADAARTFSVDSVAPTVSAIAVTPAFARVSSDVRVVFDTSEAVATPAVVVEDQPMILVAASNGNRRFEFRRTVVAGDEEGLAPITISVTDAAGNVGIAGTAVEIDKTRPLALEASASPAIAKGGDTVVYTVTPNEPVPQPPVLTIGGAPFNLQFQTGTSFIYTARVEDTVQSGTRTVSIALTDRAGNTNTVSGAPFSIDKDAPAVTAFTTTARVSRVVGRNVVTTRFTVADADSIAVVVRVAGRLAACSTAGTAFTCTATVLAADTEGAKSVTVEATDPAGNIGIASGVTFFDFTPPTMLASAQRLTPATAEPLNPAVTAARTGTLIDVDITLSEPVEGAPTLTPTITTTLAFALSTPAPGPTYAFKGTVPASATEALTPLRLEATDLAGNTASLTLPGVTVDRTAPSRADVSTPERIVYTRSPWGRIDDASPRPAPTFRIDGAARAVENGAIVIAFNTDATTGTANEIVRARADLTGAFVLPLNAADRPDVFLAVVDDAGNASARVRVRDVSWTATMGNKVAGSTFENPHRFESRSLNTQALDQLDAEERGTGDVNNLNFLFRRDGLAFAVDGQPGFSELRSVDAASSNGAVWDSNRDVVIVTGGRTGVREFDGVRWHDVPVRDPEGDGNPTFTNEHRIAYNPIQDVVVLVDDDRGTWTWNGTSWTRLRDPEQGGGDIPSARTRIALAFDPEEGGVLLFGGNLVDTFNACTSSNQSCANDLWLLKDDVWIPRATTGVRPAVREGATMAFNLDQGAMVLFGGENADGPFNDTWIWNGAWRQVSDPGSPSARAGAAMVHDPFLGGLVLFGGGTFNDGAVAPTSFFFDGDAWGALPLTGELPSGRVRHGFVYDQARDTWVLVGGVAGDDSCNSVEGGPCNDTWRGTPDGWQRTAATTFLDGLPPPRSGAAAAFDTRRGRTLMFGGTPMTRSTTPACTTSDSCDDLWELDGAGWKKRTATGSLPTRRTGAAAAYDSTVGAFVMFGGSSSAVCDGTGGPTCDGLYRLTTSSTTATWARLTPGTRPGARREAAMAFDTGRARTVMFGGRTNNGVGLAEHWELNAAGTGTWQQRCLGTPNPCTLTPAARIGAAMAFDSARNRTVLFGGLSSDRDVYEFDGTTWRRITPAGVGPLQRLNGSMSYDQQRQRVIYTNAESCGRETCDTWEWNGSVWTRIADVVASPGGDGRPVQRTRHNTVYDPVRKEVVIFGGTSTWDTWRYTSAVAAAPAQVLVVDFGAAGAPPRGSLPGQTTVVGVGLSWTASGVGFVGANRTPGVQVIGRDNGRRRLIVSSAGEGLRTMTRPVTASGFVIGRDDRIVLSLEPLADNGTGATRGSVATDAVEVTVKYRLPD